MSTYTATVQLDTLFRWFYCHSTTSSPMWFVIRFAINKDMYRHLSHSRQCYMSPCNNCRDICRAEESLQICIHPLYLYPCMTGLVGWVNSLSISKTIHEKLTFQRLCHMSLRYFNHGTLLCIMLSRAQNGPECRSGSLNASVSSFHFVTMQ